MKYPKITRAINKKETDNPYNPWIHLSLFYVQKQRNQITWWMVHK